MSGAECRVCGDWREGPRCLCDLRAERARLTSRTRERYRCVRFGRFTVGLQDDAAPLDETMLGDIVICAVDVVQLEDAIRRAWPDRAFWIEVGDDESWVQVVEYGAFAGKVHKAGGA